MNSGALSEPGRWIDGALPANVRVGANTLLTADYAFMRFRSRRPEALVIGTIARWTASTRITDIAAGSLLSKDGRPRIAQRPVVIYHDIWIGPNATILKAIRLGANAFIRSGGAGNPRCAGAGESVRQPTPGDGSVTMAAHAPTGAALEGGALNAVIEETAYLEPPSIPSHSEARAP